MNGSEENGRTLDAAKRKRRQRLRWIARGACLAAAVTALSATGDTARWTVVVSSLSPWIAVGSLVSTWTFHTTLGLGWIVLGISLFRRRWFCRWVCPTGVCADVASGLGRRMKRRPPRVANLGQWIVWITLGAAVLGYPFLLWLDPLAIFSSLFRLAGPHPGLAPWLGPIAFFVLMLVSLVWPHVWCGQACPLGAFQDLVYRLRRLRRTWRDQHEIDRTSPRWKSPPLARRAALGLGIGVLWSFVARRVRGSAPPPLRPPGRLEGLAFLGVCVRCGNCVRACPAHIIASDLGEQGVAGLLTPVLSFRDDYCREDCVRCTDVCPSGALTRLSVEDKSNARIGFPRVDMHLCLLGEDLECAECMRHCPYEAIRYVWSESDYTLAPHVDPALCPGCGACERACPTEPKKAIVVWPV